MLEYREQAARESKFGRHGMYTLVYLVPMLTWDIAATQGRSVTSMAAYEGQSGSKDRGDPEVCAEKALLTYP